MSSSVEASEKDSFSDMVAPVIDKNENRGRFYTHLKK